MVEQPDPHGAVDALDAIPAVSAGAKQRGRLRFSHPLLAGWDWPYTLIRGATDGPRLALISGVHPTEYPAIEATIRMAREVDPVALRGTLLCLPIVTPPAFFARSAFVNPIDGKNANRYFPGDPNGSFTEAMADALFRSVIAPSDYLIDLHGGDLVEALVPFTIWSETGNVAVDAVSADLARVFGLPYVVIHRPQPGGLAGMTIQAAARAGIPAITPEAGSCGLLTDADTRLLTTGVENVLRHLGMLPGAPASVAPRVFVERMTWVASPAEGLWHPSVAAGDTVKERDVVGAIVDLFGDPVAEVRAPHAGAVIFVTTSPAMKRDGVLLAIGGR